MAYKRYLGVDYGEARTGLAVSDLMGMTAQGLRTVSTRRVEVLLEEIKKEADSHDVAAIVLGHPVNMNGTLGEKSEKVKALAEMLKDYTGRRVVLFDERCTTMLAHQILNATDTRGKKRKAVVDTLSAEIILQNFLDRLRITGEDE
ncbi:MAG: Holliday junction resolvase RuvX [Clostridia bacterium]|nr:Holliday junction resolvase RuvX [Clostridia bacterium]